jgi:thiosulfate sulfurtransferase
VNLVDIRAPEDRDAGHIPGSTHLTSESLQSFIAEVDKEKPLIVYCYHGNISQSAGRYLVQQGFRQVYSMNGGFKEWSAKFPDLSVLPADAPSTD